MDTDSPNEAQTAIMQNDTGTSMSTMQLLPQGVGGNVPMQNAFMREGNPYMNWPPYPGPMHPGFNPMFASPYPMMPFHHNPTVPTNIHSGINNVEPTSLAMAVNSQQAQPSLTMTASQTGRTIMNSSPTTSTPTREDKPNGTWVPTKGRSGPEHCHNDGSLCTSYREHEASAIIDQDPSYVRALGIMKALVVHEYFAAKRSGISDPFGVQKEPEVQGTLYTPPPARLDDEPMSWHTRSRGPRRGAPLEIGCGGSVRSHPYTNRNGTVGREVSPSIPTDGSPSGLAPKATVKPRSTARYIPLFGSIDPDPFEDGEQRFVAIRNLHYRPGHGPAPGFVWDVYVDGKLQEDRGNLGRRSYEMTERVEPMSIPGQFTRKARSYPVDEHSARGTIRHGHTEGNIAGFYALIDIHRGINLRRHMERECGVYTITAAEGIIEAEFTLPLWAKRSVFMDWHGISSKENVYDWAPIKVPSVEQPHLINSSDRHYAYWIAVHGNIIDHPGVFITDSGFIDLNTIDGYRFLCVLDHAPGAESSKFKELFITLLSLPKCYGQLVEFHGLNIAPLLQLVTCPYEPKTLVDVARHMANCGITESQADSLLQYSRFFCMDKLQSKPRGETEVGPWLGILRCSNLRMLVTDCVPERDPTLPLPDHWNREDLKEYRRRRAVVYGQKARGQLPAKSQDTVKLL
ncbi:hypothetical protein FB446DRAFT_806284 [Lentinula raphanica]|nr:hypothetical protein FB446DRAFT_806284 [Lentinula raphanica]